MSCDNRLLRPISEPLAFAPAPAPRPCLMRPVSEQRASYRVSIIRATTPLAQVHSKKLDLARTVTQTESRPLWREIIFVAIISFAQFTTQFGLGQTLSIINVIGDHFNLHNGGELSWLIAAYSLTVGTFILMAGRLGDMYGYKLMLICGFSWFSLWSLVAGLAYYSTHVLFIFARVLSGIGPAMLLPNGLAILGATYPPGLRKGFVFGIFGAMAPTGSILGCVFSGLFNLTFWPWTYWALSILLAALAIGTVFFVPEPARHANTAHRTFKQIAEAMDLLGGTLGVTGLILINFAWNQAGVVTWPSQAYLWVTLILGVIFIEAFFWIETRVAKYPLIPFDALSSDVAFVLGCLACGWGCFGIWFYYLFMFFLNIHHTTPLQGAAWLVPLVPAGIGAALLVGLLLARMRPGWIMLASMTAFCVGTILIATAPPHQSYWIQIFLCTLVTSFGMDLSFPASAVIISDAVRKEHQGVGASLVNTVVNYSISLALGFAGTVEYYTAHGDTLRGYRNAWYFAIGLSGLGMCLAITFLAKSYYKDWQESKRAAGETHVESAWPVRI